MLVIDIPTIEFYDEEREEFFEIEGQTLRLEHSLISLSKWESSWKKPFLSIEQKTTAQTIDYIKHMTITQNVNPDVYRAITGETISFVNAYIDDSMSATTFARSDKRLNREVITSEIIYYWMIALNIPFECQKWHLNRLLTLINVCNIKNQPKKRMSKKELMTRNRALNSARRAQLNSSG